MGNQKTAPAKAQRKPAKNARSNTASRGNENPGGNMPRANSAQLRRDLEGLDRIAVAYADAGRSTSSKTAAFLSWAHGQQQNTGAATRTTAATAA
jgi:hypothetical protein